MIKLLVCFHACEDLEVLSEPEWRSGCAKGNIDTSYLKKNFNVYDESALELACRFADGCQPVSSEKEERLCTAVTVAEDEKDRFSETLAAVGFDRVCRIISEEAEWKRTPEAGNLTSEYTASLLYAWIREQEPFDLIMTGWQSGDGNHGKVPVLLAELLGVRCITQVTDVRPAGAGHVEVVWNEGGETCSAIIAFPAVLAVGTTAGTALRVPTLRQRMAVRGRKAESVAAGDLNVQPVCSQVALQSMEVLTEERSGRMLEDLDAETAAAYMWSCIGSNG